MPRQHACHSTLPWLISVSLDVCVLPFGADSQRSFMSLGDLASLASLVSSVAVLVSLLFLGFQMRQSNRNQRSLMQQGRSDRNVDLLSRLTDPKLSEILCRVFGGETLSDPEYFVLYGFTAAVFWSYEDSFFQFRSGMLDAKSWASDVATLKRLLSNPAYRAVWKVARSGIGDEYKSFLDGLAADAKHNAPGNLVNTLRQCIAEEREALQPSQHVKP
jgi:hypothetical protein